jgi:hypothetical protein
MPFVLDWKPANPQGALQLISNQPLGSKSIDSKPVGIGLEANLSFGGDDSAGLSINSRGSFTVAILNDANDPDEDGVFGSTAVKTADGALPPQLSFDPALAYVKFRAEAGVKATGSLPLGAFVGIDAEAEASAIFADYRVHQPSEQARAAFTMDISNARFATKLQDVLALKAGEALAFRFGGKVSAAVTVSWSDLFTGQLGSLGKLLGTTTPIAMSIKAGASVSFGVGVSDDFLIVFSRVDASRWRAGIRKVKSTRIAPSVDAGIDVGLANPGQLQELISATLDGVLGAPLEKVQEVLKAPSLDSLGSTQRKIAQALLDRLGLKDEMATSEALRARVAAIREKIAGNIEKVLKTRIALSFAYEYNRMTADTNLLQATFTAEAITALHPDVIKGKSQSTVEAIRAGRSGIDLELYLNQKEITRTHCWGFTLGFGKWATIGGKDFKTVSTIRRTDFQNRVQDSYLGARSYTGTWVDEKSEWGVDLKADMKNYSAEPLVNDFSFGIHLLWVVEQRDLSASELEEWLDSGVVWRVFREQDVIDIRARLAPALSSRASLNVQLTIPNSVVRAVLPALAVSPIESFAPALALAMPWMKVSDVRQSAARRRQLYAPLWAMYLTHPDHTQGQFAAAAERHVKKAGRTELILTERTPVGPNAFSFAGLTHINGDTLGACAAFTRGSNILNTAINSGARNQKTIDKAVGEMDDLWQQSHHVRAIGAYLLDAAERAGVLADVTRTMTVDVDDMDSVVITA